MHYNSFSRESQRLEQLHTLLGFVVLIRLIISAIKSTVISFLRKYHIETYILGIDMLEVDDLCHIEALLFL